MKLHYAGFQPHASGFGWATCNANLRRELAKHFELVDFIPHSEFRNPHSDVVFMPLLDHDFNPASPARGRINFAYTFFEFPLGRNAKTNADKYDIVFCGSSWCLERMREAGIPNGEVLIQGVDQEIFKCGMRTAECGIGQFRIFSGGKFEYRKGQDLVIAAFKEFAGNRPDAHLVCSWFNPWPALITQDSWRMEINTHLPRRNESQQEFFASLLALNGLRPDQYTILPPLDQHSLALEMTNTDAGLFPNRCEGGTNLVLMEYACCGGKIIANIETGHADVALAVHYPIPATRDANHWAQQEIEDIAAALEIAYQGNAECGMRNAEYCSAFTWARAAGQIRGAALTLSPQGR